MQGQIPHLVIVNVSFVFDLIGGRILSLACITCDSSP